MKRMAVIALNLYLSIAFTHLAWSISGQDVLELKKAGVSDRTIQLIAKEKVIETAAFSTADIVAMKKAGVAEKTLQMLVKEGSYLKNFHPIIYGKNTQPIRFTTARDVIELKQAGLSDEVIQAIIAVTGERYYSQHEEAYDLLRSMGVVVDSRADRRERKKDPLSGGE